MRTTRIDGSYGDSRKTEVAKKPSSTLSPVPPIEVGTVQFAINSRFTDIPEDARTLNKLPPVFSAASIDIRGGVEPIEQLYEHLFNKKFRDPETKAEGLFHRDAKIIRMLPIDTAQRQRDGRKKLQGKILILLPVDPSGKADPLLVTPNDTTNALGRISTRLTQIFGPDAPGKEAPPAMQKAVQHEVEKFRQEAARRPATTDLIVR